MSSMWRAAVILPVVLAGDRASESRRNMRRRPHASYSYAPPAANVGYALNQWRQLRQSSGYSFADYARFLIANPRLAGRIEDAQLGREGDAARRECRDRSSPSSPTTSRRPATAGRGLPTPMPQAVDRRRRSTRRATPGASPTSASTDEQAIWTRYGSSFTRADQDRRVDALLFAKKADDAARFLTAATPATARRPSRRGSRCSSESRRCRSPLPTVIGTVTSDAGLMMDRARYLRANDYESAARAARCPCSQFHLPARRSRTLLRHAAPARGRRGAGPAIGRPPIDIASPDRRRPPAGSAGQRPAAWRSATITPASPGSAGNIALDRLQSALRARSRCSTATRTRGTLAAGPDQGQLLGRTRRAGRRAVRRSRTAISSAPRPIRSCSTDSWRSNGSGAASPRRHRRCRNM